MTQIGTVIKTEGGVAIVRVARASACEGCHKKAEGCSACSLLGGDKQHTARVGNPVGARPGDRVEIEASDGRVIAYAALVFLFPLALAVLGYFLGTVCFSASPLASGLFAAGGFLLAFLVVFCVSLAVSRKAPVASIIHVITNRNE